jgi:hypothetical protein
VVSTGVLPDYLIWAGVAGLMFVIGGGLVAALSDHDHADPLHVEEGAQAQSRVQGLILMIEPLG